MFIRKIIIFFLVLNIYVIHAIQVLTKMNHFPLAKTSLRVANRTLFYKKNLGKTGIGSPVFNNCCCQQEYYVKDGKVHRIFHEEKLLPQDQCYGYSVREVDGRKIIETHRDFISKS